MHGLPCGPWLASGDAKLSRSPGGARWLVFDLAAALAVGLLASQRWGYPWQLAVLTGGAVGALTYATRRTYFNLRQIHESPPGWDDDEA